jgi:hypothetical protein
MNYYTDPGTDGQMALPVSRILNCQRNFLIATAFNLRIRAPRHSTCRILPVAEKKRKCVVIPRHVFRRGIPLSFPPRIHRRISAQRAGARHDCWLKNGKGIQLPRRRTPSTLLLLNFPLHQRFHDRPQKFLGNNFHHLWPHLIQHLLHHGFHQRRIRRGRFYRYQGRRGSHGRG